MQTIAVARNAMATRFEILLHGADQIALRAAAEEALDEIERLDAQLSLYRASSEISWINARAAFEPIRVEPQLFRLLEHARRLHAESQGAFDITIAPLVRCWGFMGGTGKMPEPAQVAHAREVVGMQWLNLNEDNFTIHFERPGMMIDLGAIGKGYALDRATNVLLEAGIRSALLHGGTSTVYAIGAPPDSNAWKVGIETPPDFFQPRRMAPDNNVSSPEPLAVVSLKDEALSVSGVHGRSFQLGTKTFGHVIDPKMGEPVQGALLSAVILPSGTETDALSTALLAAGSHGHKHIASLRQGMRTLLVTRGEENELHRIESHGIEIGQKFR